MVADFASLQSLLATKEIIICCGSGGVGKTSIAASIALGATKHVGGRVLVITVDPARRLASALGLGELGNVPRRIDIGAVDSDDPGCHGELWAVMLDTKQSWDDLVMRHAPDEATAFRILDNRLYHSLTARFVQSHDYIAMERLYELHESGHYDLIVVDTPPTRNALDFLDAPKRMAEFFRGRLLRWLTLPYRVGGRRGTRLIEAASRPFYQVADRLLGSRFLHEIAEFFLNFQTMYDGFVERSVSVERLVADHRTSFVVVSTLENSPLREAELFTAELRKRGVHVGAMILNKTLPGYLLDADGATVAKQLLEDSDGLASLVAPGDDRTARVMRTIAQSYQNFAIVAAREAELRAGLSRESHLTIGVPARAADISDLDGLGWISVHLFDNGSVA